MTARNAIHKKLKELDKIAHGEAHIILLLADYVAREPKDLKAAWAYADALRIVGRTSDATRIFKRAFESTSKNTTKSYAAIRIAMCCETASPMEAEKWFTKASELDDTLPGWAWILRGANLARLERFEAAIDCYARALKSKDIDRDEALRNIATAYRALGDYETFGAYVRRALAAAPNDKELKQLKASLKGMDQTRAFAKALSTES